MMKRILITICLILLPFTAWANGPEPTILVMVSPANPASPGIGVSAECTIPGSPDVSHATQNNTNTLAGSAAEGQSFASGTGGKLAKFCIYATDEGTDPVITCRIGTSTDLGTYLEEFTSGTITGDQEYCWDSVEKPTLSASTTYYWGCIEVSGGAGLGFDDAGGYADGVFYYNNSGWALGGTESGYDHYFKVFYCD